MNDTGSHPQSDGEIPLRWTLERNGTELELQFRLGGPAHLYLGVPEGAIAEEPGYEMALTKGDAVSLAGALQAWAKS